MEPQAECMLVLVGATPEGRKELVGFQVGLRESTQSWRELLVDLKAHGLAVAPELATGDGALGFWKALEEVWPTTRHQRCTVHTIHTQSRVFRRRRAVAARRWGTQWDNMADFQAAFADDDALDDQLQDGLLLRQGSIGQAAADAIAERRHVGPHRLSLEPLLA
jgi:transposase-like protein